MTDPLSYIHFIRPVWLLAIPLLWLLQWWWQRRSSMAGWAGHIAADKIAVLRIDANRLDTNQWKIHAGLLYACSAIVCIALAGPSLHALPGKVAGNRQAMVILFDLSPSMLARDISPNRLQVAQLKLIDLLRRRSDGETALIAYAGDAHRVTPLTDDPAVIEALVHTLHPDIMPLAGNQPEEAVTLALELFAGAKLTQGDIVFITDGIPEDAALAIDRDLQDNFRLSILAVGTTAGAPIPLGDSGFLRDQNNTLVMAQLDSAVLENLAASHNGRFINNTIDGTDIDHLSSLSPLPFRARVKGELQTFDSQHDAGYWLVLLLLPLALYSFRRHVLWMAVPIALVSPDSYAVEWSDLWRTANQKAAAALQRNDNDQAQRLFTNPKWKAIAAFRNGNYAAAADLLAQATTADDYYNRGTSLAALGEFEQSIEDFDQALSLYGNPETTGYSNTLINRSLVLQWMEEEQQSATEEESSDRSTDGDDSKDKDDESDVDSNESNRGSTAADQPTVGGAVGAGGSLDQAQLEQQGTSGNRQKTPEDETIGTPDDATPVNEPGAINTASNLQGFDADTTSVVIEQHNSGVLNPYSEQWLRNLPQDPGGYMRRKFQYQALIKQTADSQTNQNEPSTVGMRY